MKWKNHISDPRRRHALATRARVESLIREFFIERNFLETRTPILVPCPGMEPHIRPFQIASGRSYLHTSPEFAMKRLLVGGLERIFQISTAFRDEPPSKTHRPEFTLLEWYRANAGYDEIMSDSEALFEKIALATFGKPGIPFQGKHISVQTPWPRLKIRDLFLEFADIDLAPGGKVLSLDELESSCRKLELNPSPKAEWDDLFFSIWLNQIEPQLPSDRAVFVYRYPPSQAALSVIDADSDGSRWARRFEIYAGGLELANAFEELTDPIEQRTRFIKDMELRNRVYGESFPITPLDEDFLNALSEGMPPSGGIALGVDRMVMLFADEPEINYTIWIPSYLKE